MFPTPEKNVPGKRIWASLDPFIEPGDILGRKVANASFLKALLQEHPYDAYHFFLSTPQEIEGVSTWLQTAFPTLWEKGCFAIHPQVELHKHMATTAYHCFHLSDFLTHQVSLARMRNTFAQNIFPITGLTHSLSYARFMPKFLEHFWPGTTTRDIIIASSRSAKSMLAKAFQHLGSCYGMGSEAASLPEIEIIPLAVNPNDCPTPDQRWDTGDNPQKAQELRAKLGIENKVMFLCLGRISHFSKMDILPVLYAFKRAESLGLKKDTYALVLSGFTEKGATLPELLKKYAKSLGIELHTMLNPDNNLRSTLYAAADIFLSPADNLQETFGLTVVEAGLSGLPVIVSDFNGYKDTVIHGETGFTVPSIAPETTVETNVLSALWFDNQYHFKAAQNTVIDVPSMAKCMAQLGMDANLRHRMGKKAREHALQNFSWPVVIKKYVHLWNTLAERKLHHNNPYKKHPLGMDFGSFFSSHSTVRATELFLTQHSIKITGLGQAVFRKTIQPFAYAGLENIFDQNMVHMLLFIARKEIVLKEAVDKLLENHSQQLPHLDSFKKETAINLILWCLKNDYVELTTPINELPGQVTEPSCAFKNKCACPNTDTTPQQIPQPQADADLLYNAAIGKQTREIMHDMRTPLAIIHGAAELIKESLLEDKLTPETAEQTLKAIEMIGKHVDGIISIMDNARSRKNNE